ncbi:MAG: PD40 domain-containing protein [Thaumarchaeota archaeon]|nr:PD40 domain-containing protein [Nitrososphaerota archaeon]MDE1838442.1 PD40 domain-containing protein [Nitrososphaerota archaeon]
MKTLHLSILTIPVLVVLVMGIFYYPHQSNAIYEGPMCNEKSLLGFPLASPYFVKKIAFVSNVGSADPSNFTLYAVNSDGSGSLDKISTIPYQTAIAMSSDGTKIAFLRQVNKTNQIFVADTDGTGLKQMTFDNAIKSVIGITPDGKKIIYNHYDSVGRINNYDIMDSDGKSHIQITNDSSRKVWPALSFDGTTLVFHDESKPPQIFAVRTDGSDFHHVTNGSLFSHTPVISRNGSKLVFSRDNPADSNSKYLFTINTDGTDLVQLTQKPIYTQSDFTVSLDGSKVAFDDGSNLAYYVSVINSDGTGYKKMTNTDTYYSHTPLLSSDGSKLIYSSVNPTQTLFMSDVKNGGSPLEVDSGMIWYEKEISPDTAEIVYPKIVDNTEEILAATYDGKTFPLFDNSIFMPNPNCTIPYDGPMGISHPPHFMHMTIVEPWYAKVPGWIWVGIVSGAVISFWIFYFRHFRE